MQNLPAYNRKSKVWFQLTEYRLQLTTPSPSLQLTCTPIHSNSNSKIKHNSIISILVSIYIYSEVLGWRFNSLVSSMLVAVFQLTAYNVKNKVGVNFIFLGSESDVWWKKSVYKVTKKIVNMFHLSAYRKWLVSKTWILLSFWDSSLCQKFAM